MYLKALFYMSFVNVAVGRDFVIGMLRGKDILVTQDIVYKERMPYRQTILKYGKTFACPLTYFRVADRLGFGNGPKVMVIRGGLHKKYIAIKMWAYNLPIAVTIQAGCVAPPPTTTVEPKTKKEKENNDDSNSDNEEDDEATATEGSDTEDNVTVHEGDEDEASTDKDDTKNKTKAEPDENEGEANENESLRRANLII